VTGCKDKQEDNKNTHPASENSVVQPYEKSWDDNSADLGGCGLPKLRIQTCRGVCNDEHAHDEHANGDEDLEGSRAEGKGEPGRQQGAGHSTKRKCRSGAVIDLPAFVIIDEGGDIPKKGGEFSSPQGNMGGQSQKNERRENDQERGTDDSAKAPAEKADDKYQDEGAGIHLIRYTLILKHPKDIGREFIAVKRKGD